MYDLIGKVAVVTGATAGIGETVVEELFRCGASVVLAARRGTEEAAERLGQTGERALAVPTDVRDHASVRAMVESAVERFGGCILRSTMPALPAPAAPTYPIWE